MFDLNSISRRFLQLAILFAICTIQLGYAQESRVLVENATYATRQNPAVLVKWYSGELLYNEGINIYRKKEGSLSWEKVNTTLVLKKKAIPASAIADDPDLQVLQDMVESTTAQELKQDIVLFTILVKSFQSNVFADYLGIYFEDTEVEEGVKYEYKVNKIKNGREYLVGVSSPVLAGAWEPGTPVDSVEVYQKGKTINLNWHADDDRFYAINIYRKASGDTAAIKLNKNPLILSQVTDSLGKETYPDPMFTENKDLVEGRKYTYQLAGLGFFGNETQRSEPVEVMFEDVTPPSAPQNITGKADSMKVHLSWENVETADLQGINVYRSSKSDGSYEIINPSILDISHPQYDDTLLIPGPYYYYVAATDYSGNEAHSNLIFVEVQDVIPPARPQKLTLKADTGRISLHWQKGAEPDIDGYYVYRTVDENNKKNYVLLNAIPIKENHFEQELPKNVKNKFFYFVVAVDTSYNRSEPSVFVSGKIPDILPPEKPFIKKVTYENDNIIVEWVPNVDNDLAGYHIYRSDTTKKFQRLNINLLAGSTYRYTDRDNAPNTDYFYYLEARDSVGNTSMPSKAVYARRVVKKLSEDQGIDLKLKYSKRRKSNRLQWQEVDKPDMKGYVVYRGKDENTLKPLTGLIQATKFTDKINAGNSIDKYYYQVRAYAGKEIIYSPKKEWKQK